MLNRVLLRAVLATVLAAGLACGNADENASIDESLLGNRAFREGNTSEAIQHFKKATSIYPQNHIAHYNLGKVYQSQSKWEEAATAFSDAAKYNDKDAMYAYAAGRANYEAKRLSEAETQLEHAISLNERLYKAHYFIGRVYIDSDRPGKAAAAWTQSAKLNPFFGKPFIELGRLYYKWDMLPQAISVLDQGSRHVKEASEVSLIFLLLGLSYDSQQNWDKAIEAYTQALKYRPDNVEAKLQRGFAYNEKGDPTNAKKDLEEFVKVGGGGNPFNVQAANQVLMLLARDQAVDKK